MTSDNQSQPLLTAVYQGLIEPQQSCVGLVVVPVQGILMPPFKGDWDVQIRHHRIAVTFRIEEFDADANQIIGQLRDLGRDIATLVLQAQTLYSGQVLKLGGYTMTTQFAGGRMKPIWIELEERPVKNPKRVQNDDFEKAIDEIASTALYSGHDNLQRALQEYQQAVEIKNKDSLIYLWKAVEEILWFYDERVGDPNTSIKDLKSPGYKYATKVLQLGGSTESIEWLEEIAGLAHGYARHAEGRPSRNPLPPSLTLEDCIEIARMRVVELIRRHALDLSVRPEQWGPLKSDGLTGWLNAANS